jgi:hypothetical protein
MAVSELPGNPNAVWTVKKKTDGEFSVFIHRSTIAGDEVTVVTDKFRRQFVGRKAGF